MKVITNHVLDYRIVIVPNQGASDRSWVWTAFDFSDGELVEKVHIYMNINKCDRFGCGHRSGPYPLPFAMRRLLITCFIGVYVYL
jgi:hypothetical protein